LGIFQIPVEEIQVLLNYVKLGESKIMSRIIALGVFPDKNECKKHSKCDRRIVSQESKYNFFGFFAIPLLSASFSIYLSPSE
jgi:hypothetical protein